LILARHGFPLGRQLQSFAIQFYKQRSCYALTKTAEDAGMLGQHWLDVFLKHNPALASRKAESRFQLVAFLFHLSFVLFSY